MIKEVKGDLLQAIENIIGHQVNCQGVMGLGLAAKIKNKYPQAYKMYKTVTKFNDPQSLLGISLIVKVDENKYVANLFGQLNYGRNKKQYTDYEALNKALIELKEYALNNNLTVALPYGLGCGLAGGDWSIVRNLIDKTFKDYEVTIYKID